MLLHHVGCLTHVSVIKVQSECLFNCFLKISFETKPFFVKFCSEDMSMKTQEDMTMEEIREQLAIYNRLYYYKRRQEEGFMQQKSDCALKCIQKKKLNQYIKSKDNNINSTIEDSTEEQLAEFNSSQNKKGPKYDMNDVKVVMPMKAKEC